MRFAKNAESSRVADHTPETREKGSRSRLVERLSLFSTVAYLTGAVGTSIADRPPAQIRTSASTHTALTKERVMPLRRAWSKHHWQLRSVHRRDLDRSTAAWHKCFDPKSAYYLTTGPVSLPHDFSPALSPPLPTSQRLEASWSGPFFHIPLPCYPWRAALFHPDRHQPP
jgi:hypothetical protein